MEIRTSAMHARGLRGKHRYGRGRTETDEEVACSRKRPKRLNILTCADHPEGNPIPAIKHASRKSFSPSRNDANVHKRGAKLLSRSPLIIMDSAFFGFCVVCLRSTSVKRTEKNFRLISRELTSSRSNGRCARFKFGGVWSLYKSGVANKHHKKRANCMLLI